MLNEKKLTVKKLNKHWPGAAVFTSLLVGLVALAIGDVSAVWVAVVGAIGGITACLLFLFPSSPFFYVVFNNGILIYCCLFVFFVESIFQNVEASHLVIGFLLPLAAYLIGAIWRRKEILAIVTSDTNIQETEFIKSLSWLLPVFAIGILAATLPILSWPEMYQSLFFLGAMNAIAAIVLFASRGITVLLMDTALYFSDFLKTTTKLVKPAFAFFSFYTMNVIIFACLYRLVDRFSSQVQFKIEGTDRGLTFVESLYFSIVTVSTLGYGDIVPLSYLVRLLVGMQLVTGVLLVLFGVHAILIHSRRNE